MKPLLAAVLLVVIVNSAPAVVVVNDPFSDGDRANGSDPLDVAWYRSRSDLTVSVANDSTIGTGNAMSFSSPTLGAILLAPFPLTTLGPQAGATVTLSFDFHSSSTQDPDLRFGLLNGRGTPVTADGFENAADADDTGYFSNPGLANPSDTLNSGSPGNQHSACFNRRPWRTRSGVAFPRLDDSTRNQQPAKHSASLMIQRQSDGNVLVSAIVDNYSASAVDSSANKMSSFDEIGIRGARFLDDRGQRSSRCRSSARTVQHFSVRLKLRRRARIFKSAQRQDEPGPPSN